MSSARSRFRKLALLLIPAAALCAVAAYFLWPAGGDMRLREFVHARPPVPIVFTSRTEAASLWGAAEEGEGFAYPGRGLWQAREGRLRLLKPNGSIHELTWGKPLPDGSTLIDVMSPSVSIDGKRIYFAGRKAPPDPGRFRLYSINIDGSELRQLTGGPDDPGCAELPPMRYRSENDKTILPDDDRRRVDYDDVDPVELHFQSPRLAFASSRTPDFGRNSTRRSTNIWELRLDDSAKRPLTANRFNDRWPFLLSSNFVAFSLWSRNQEVVAPGESDVVSWKPDLMSPCQACDMWIAAFLQPVGGQFGGLLKPGIPVWRPRPLFNGRIVFQTRFGYGLHKPVVVGGIPTQPAVAEDPPWFSVVQAEPGLLLHSPSASTVAARPAAPFVQPGPGLDAKGNALRLATPSPCPSGHIVLAAMKAATGTAKDDPRGYGIWICRDDWDAAKLHLIDSDHAGIRPLFDDPDFVDAEPVAVYARHFDRWMDATDTPPAGTPPPITLADGTKYTGPSGTFFGSSLYVNQHTDVPGQLDASRGSGPFFTAPPAGQLDHVRVYASHRDRFDDPVKPRVDGKWELLLKSPVKGETFGAQVPAGVPVVLAGFDRNGHVVSWTNAPPTSPDEPPAPPQSAARFFAFAGDHYSAARAGGKHFCIGCHPGHSGLGTADHRHHERQR